METYLELLEDSLPEEGHPQRELWREYALSGEQRAQEPLGYIERYSPLPDALLLDLGCGDGGFTVAASKRGFRVISTEISSATLKRTQARLYDKGVLPHILQGSGLRLPFKDDTFDIVVLQDVIEHVPDPVSLIKECYRVTKEGGLFYISAANAWYVGHIMSDPHWGRLGVSLMPHWLGKFYICKLRKISSVYDVWYLPSHSMLSRWLCSAGFLNTQEKEAISQQIWKHFNVAIVRAIGIKHSTGKIQ